MNKSDKRIKELTVNHRNISHPFGEPCDFCAKVEAEYKKLTNPKSR